MRKHSMSEEAEEHVLLRLTYLLACLLHTIITIRVVSNAGLLDLDNNCQSPISAMDSFIC